VERLSTHGSIEASSEWHESPLTRDSATVTGDVGPTARVAYRLLCDTGYYGRRCSLSCNARRDKFGHYTCADNGTRVCLDGWTGSFCDVRTYDARFTFITLLTSHFAHPAGHYTYSLSPASYLARPMLFCCPVKKRTLLQPARPHRSVSRLQR